MSESWYCLAFGIELGPMSWDDLVERAARGDLKPESQIRRGDARAWVAAETVAGLFAAPGASAAADGWYCEILGAELGPMPFDELKLLAERGNLRADNRVRREAGDWSPASQVAGLSVLPSVASETSAARETISPHETPDSDFAGSQIANADGLEPISPEPQIAESRAAELHVSDLAHDSAPLVAAESPATTPKQARKPKGERKKTERPPASAALRRASFAPRVSGRAVAALGGIAAAAGLVYVGYASLGRLRSPEPDPRQVAGAFRQVYDELKRFREAPNPRAEIGLRFQFSRHVASLRKQIDGAVPESVPGKLGQAGAQLAEMLGSFNARPGSPQAQQFAESEQRFLTLLESVPGPNAAAELAP